MTAEEQKPPRSQSRELGVVVASQEDPGTVTRCLEALRREVAGRRAQVVLVDGSIDSPGLGATAALPGVEVVRCPPDLLVPELWGVGLVRITAPLVALLSATCVPEPGWLDALLRAARERPEAAGVGGPIDGPGGGESPAPAVAWALFFARYSAYMPPLERGEVSEIPGDNALYRQKALEWAWTERDRGFWEALVHRRLRERGAPLVMEPDAVVRLGRSSGPGALARARFRHGRHFGATRSLEGAPGRILRAISVPVLPALFVSRIARQLLGRRREYLGHFLRSLPWLLLFLGAWTVGEGVGYLRGRG